MTLRDLIQQAEYGKVDAVSLTIFWDDTRPRERPPTNEDIERAAALKLRFSAALKGPMPSTRVQWQPWLEEGKEPLLMARVHPRISDHMPEDDKNGYIDWRLETPNGDPVPWSELRAGGK